MCRFLVAVLLAFVPLPLRAAPPAEPFHPTRITTPPRIDGVLDDEAWQTATQVSDFKTWRPDFEKDPQGKTTVYAAYDAENMFFAFRAFDAEPSRIKASMASRDSIRPDDWICINLDSFGDQQALYAFYVNPLGIQMDSRYAANQEDLGFDAVWYSAGRVDDKGYIVEVRIPFKSIRYSGKNPVTMRVIFERNDSRHSEGSMYPAMDPRAGYNFLIQTMPMAFENIKHYTLLEVLPDATFNRQEAAPTGTLVRTAGGPDFGATVKYGITAQLTADGTYNPDFSQVEADAGQIDINLRHPLFFPEKRPFFLEGNEVFNIAGPSQNGVLLSVLHTRTIANPLVGAKVSGKLARADTIAGLYAIDEVPTDASLPDAQVSVGRYKRALSQDGYLGGFYVGREQGPSYNRVAGADGTIRLSQSTNTGFHAFGSSTATVEGRREDGHALGTDVSMDTRRVSFYAAAYDVSRGFRADSGYLTRNGVATVLGVVDYKFYPARKAVQRVQMELASQQTHDAFADIWETFNQPSAVLTLPRATTIRANCALSTEVYLDEEFDTSGCGVTGSSQLRKQLRVQAAVNRGNAIYYTADPFGGRATRATATLVYQPSEQLSETLSATYANFDRAGGPRLYDYAITRSRTTFQFNRYFFTRAILEYNSYRRELMTDFLASFTYIPGSVLHAGYGSLYEKTRWDGLEDVRGPSLRETRRGVFFKASYLWRL
ncbi:MAG: DUF5916 domain-containing protein [Bacteroidales bacterium]